MNLLMNEHTVALTRVFDAPRARVFECWTRAEHLQHWFGPKGFAIHSCETDPRPGGVFKLCMRAPDGRDYWVRGRFRELDSPKHLVIDCAADDDKGVERLHEVIEVTFTEAQGRTTVAINAVARGPSDEAAAMLKGMDKGWAQTVDRLGAHLRKETHMQIQPYLFFDGRAEEALEFYRKALGAKVEMLMRYKDNPEPAYNPPNAEQKVMHACVRIGDTAVMASDGQCTGKPGFQGFSLTISAASPAEAEKRFAALAEGGQVQMPLNETFFAERYGMVADRFGVSWMVIAGPKNPASKDHG